MKTNAVLSETEKKHYCGMLTVELVELRNKLGLTQEEMEYVSGISRVTLSQIESGRSHMSWLHFVSLMLVFTQNQDTKEILFVRRILDERLLRAYQNLQPEETVDYNARVKEQPMDPASAGKTPGPGGTEDFD